MPAFLRHSAFILGLLALMANTPPSPGALIVDSSKMSRRQISELKGAPEVRWWLEAGNELFVSVTDISSSKSLTKTLKVKSVVDAVSLDDLVVLHAGHTNELGASIPILFKGGRSVVIAKADAAKLLQGHEGHDHYSIEPLKANTVLATRITRDEAPSTWSGEQRSTALQTAGLVDGARWFEDVKKLASWNRHISAKGNSDAREFIKTQFEAIGDLAISTQEFSVSGRKAWNVIAKQPSSHRDADVILVTGHYDSTSQSSGSGAPGAEDNASGAAGVIELARVASQLDLGFNLVFIAFSGEEQGLIGSKAYVQELTSDERAKIKAVINMDMIGYTKDDSLDVLLETSKSFVNLADHLAEAAAAATSLNVFRTLNPYGSDHMPFINKGIPALLTIDNDWGDYPSYHRTTDTIDKVSQAMGFEILKMNAAALAAWR